MIAREHGSYARADLNEARNDRGPLPRHKEEQAISKRTLPNYPSSFVKELVQPHDKHSLKAARAFAEPCPKVQ